MKLIAQITDELLGLTLPATPIDRIRHAARGVLADKSGRIAVMHVTRHGYFKLPGGGMEEGDDGYSMNFVREIREETGWECENVRPIGITVELRKQERMMQVSMIFLCDATIESGRNLDESEQERGFELEWIDIDDAIEKISASSDHENYEVKFISRRDTEILKEAKKAVSRP